MAEKKKKVVNQGAIDKKELRLNIESDRIDMVSSLMCAVSNAGGVVYRWNEYKHTTVEEMVIALAQNGIRFTFERSK